MRQKLITISSITYFAVVLLLLFAPEEVLRSSRLEPVPAMTLVVQLVGCGAFGFAMLNWMNRFTVAGGIYARPLVVANLANAGSASALLAKVALRPDATLPILAALAVYLLIAIAFGYLLITAPPTEKA